MNCHLTTDTKPNREKILSLLVCQKPQEPQGFLNPTPPQRLLNLYTNEYAAEMCGGIGSKKVGHIIQEHNNFRNDKKCDLPIADNHFVVIIIHDPSTNCTPL
jgi:hypothetical protein